ncbi:colicin release lysis protein (plasmid) [Klebsiella sp. WOUb02]
MFIFPGKTLSDSSEYAANYIRDVQDGTVAPILLL